MYRFKVYDANSQGVFLHSSGQAVCLTVVLNKYGFFFYPYSHEFVLYWAREIEYVQDGKNLKPMDKPEVQVEIDRLCQFDFLAAVQVVLNYLPFQYLMINESM